MFLARRSLLSRVQFLPVLMVLFATPALAAPINLNPFFDDGLNNWDVSGNVTENGTGFATTSDSDGFAGEFSQITLIGVGDFTLSFDLLNDIGLKGNSGNPGVPLPDVAFGSLYLSNTPDVLTNVVPFQAFNLYDADSSGVMTGLSVSALANNWNRYTLSFHSDWLYATLVFQLFDLDFVPNSAVSHDNIRIDAVPEPLTGLLLGAGLIPLARRRFARSNSALNN